MSRSAPLILLDAAGDGAVPPAILPGSQKLGNERMQVSPDILAGTGILCDAFRDRKLLERYLETAALKNDLSLPEAVAQRSMPPTSTA